MDQRLNKIRSVLTLLLFSLITTIVISMFIALSRGYSAGEYLVIVSLEDIMFVTVGVALFILAGAFILKNKDQEIWNKLTLQFYKKFSLYCLIGLIIFGILDRFNIFVKFGI